MKIMTSLGISSYYDELPHGKKDEFVREVAAETCKSSSTVLKRLSKGNWSRLELKVVSGLIEKDVDVEK